MHFVVVGCLCDTIGVLSQWLVGCVYVWKGWGGCGNNNIVWGWNVIGDEEW